MEEEVIDNPEELEENSSFEDIKEEPNNQEENLKSEEIKEERKTKSKEVQGTIIPIDNNNNKATEDEFFSVLKMISPGTTMRTSLNGTLKAGKGALIVVENEHLLPLIDGGFRVNCRFTPQRLMELSKMDGAIVLSKDLKRINYANVLLTPSSKIRTYETGTRHKAAERTAKQTGTLVIAISERRHDITLYYKDIKHYIQNSHEVLRKATSHVQLLEKHRELFDSHVNKLNNLELRNYPSLKQAIKVVQRGRLIQKIASELKKPLIELGNESSLLKTRLKEILSDVEKETLLTIKDYTKIDQKRSKTILDTLSYDEILDEENILSALAYEKAIQSVPIKGWRLLSKTSLSDADIASIIKQSGSLGKAIHSNLSYHKETLGEEKAETFIEEIGRIKLSY